MSQRLVNLGFPTLPHKNDSRQLECSTLYVELRRVKGENKEHDKGQRTKVVKDKLDKELTNGWMDSHFGS